MCLKQHVQGLHGDDVSVGTALIEDFTDETEYSHYYVAENRVHGGYDKTLRTGPYGPGGLLRRGQPG